MGLRTSWTHTDSVLPSEEGGRRALTVVLAVDDVQRAVRRSGVLQQFGQEHGAPWDALRGLHQVGVATHHPDGEHPQRDHGGEVKRGDAGTHADGQAVGVSVHVPGDGGQRLPQHEGRNAAGMLHHLWEGEGGGGERMLTNKTEQR